MPVNTSIRRDIAILWRLLRGGSGATHEERLERFYSPQADAYDSFRARLLHGRDELLTELDFPADGVWVDLGAGTGENAERIGDRLEPLRRVYQVDLADSLLEKARCRVRDHNWQNVTPVKADATLFTPETPADVVTFSYSLTMIPDWFHAIRQAVAMLRPGGLLGVVDFYVSRKHPAFSHRRHGWSTRAFWPIWFAFDNVFLNPDHLPFLQAELQTLRLVESRGKVPYLPLVRVPYYRFIGRKAE